MYHLSRYEKMSVGHCGYFGFNVSYIHGGGGRFISSTSKIMKRSYKFRNKKRPSHRRSGLSVGEIVLLFLVGFYLLCDLRASFSLSHDETQAQTVTHYNQSTTLRKTPLEL